MARQSFQRIDSWPPTKPHSSSTKKRVFAADLSSSHMRSLFFCSPLVSLRKYTSVGPLLWETAFGILWNNGAPRSFPTMEDSFVPALCVTLLPHCVNPALLVHSRACRLPLLGLLDSRSRPMWISAVGLCFENWMGHDANSAMISEFYR